MIQSFIITFREALEIALIVGIFLSYLAKTNQKKYNNIVYIGIIAGIVASIIGALLFVNIAGGLTGKTEQIFEGVTTLIGALLLTTMILWMMKQKHIASELQQKMDNELTKAHKFGLFALVFVSVLREGIETVIFLGAASFVSADNNLWAALIGLIFAVILGYLIFVGSVKINIKKFFSITSIILILFAAGLVAHGIHEFQEAHIIPEVIEHVWDINPPVQADGTYPLLHEDGYIGSIFKGLLGYNASPSLIEVLAYIFYLLIAFALWTNIQKDKKII